MTSSLGKASFWLVQMGMVLAVLVVSAGVVRAQGECNDQCFTPLPSAGTNPRLVLESVRFDETDYVVLKNISGSDVDLTGWQICQEQTCAPIPAGSPLGHGGRLTIHLGAAGESTPTDVYVETFAPLEPSAGEIAIFRSDQLESASAVVAYVRWGSQAGEGSREAVALRQWEVGSFVAICPESDHVGMVAVGDVTLVRGWKAQPFRCW